MKQTIYIQLLLLCSFGAFSQGFVQITQAPLHLNPSLSGSMNGTRVGLISNYGSFLGFSRQNNYVSLDRLLEKYGIGIGASIFTYNNNGCRFCNTFYDEPIFQTIGGSFAIAPKYLIKKKDKSKRATFSPSLGIEYLKSDNESKSYSWYSNKNTYSYSNIGDVQPYILKYDETKQMDNNLALSLGLLYNSPKLMMGLVIKKRYMNNVYDHYKVEVDSSYSETILSSSTTNGKDSILYPRNSIVPQGSFKVKRSVLTFDYHISKVIKFGQSKFSIIPFVCFGVAYDNKNLSPKQNRLHLFTINSNIQFVYGRVIAGLAVSGTVNQEAIFIGYKNKYMKIMASFNSTFGELSANYTFKKRQNRE